MKKLLSFLAFAACLAVPALGQAPKIQAPETQIPKPTPAQTLPPCSQACCVGDFNAATECSYYSPNSGYQSYSQCYWWWSDGEMCSA